MTKDILLQKLKKIEEEGGYGVQKLFEDDYDGACPCFSGEFILDDEHCEVWGRCWRVSDNSQDLHVMMPKEVAKAIKRCLDAQKWYNKYTIIEHSESFLD